MRIRDDPKKPFTRLDPYSFGQTLAQKLSGNRLADPLRNLATRFGVRKYEVRIVRLRWNGGTRGLGDPFVEHEWLIEPTPRVLGMNELNESVEGPGVQETGSVKVDRISTEYSERGLRGLDRTEETYPVDVEVFWEITFFGDRTPIRRRFNLTSAPGRATFGWEVHLERALNDRDSSRTLPRGDKQSVTPDPY